MSIVRITPSGQGLGADLKGLMAAWLSGGMADALMLPLLLFVFWIGIYPNTFFEKMNPSLENLIEQVKTKQQVAMVVEEVEQAPIKLVVND